MKPILTLKLVPSTRKTNAYGFKKIHIMHFNYDGQGTALVRHDGSKNMETYVLKDLEAILLGDATSGDRWYVPV